jgi:phosphoglycerol transferase MdoB-like AlkP superfamily enzyme
MAKCDMFEGLRVKLRKLPWRMQRVFGNLGYSLRVFRGPATRRMKPSTTVLSIIVVLFVGFVLAGGIYDILERPISLLPTSYGYSVVIQGTLGQQTLNESLIAAFLYFLGLAGLYMLLRSTRYAYRPRNAYLLLILGTLTVLMVVAYSTSLINTKIGG